MPFMIVHSEERGYCVFTQDESGDPKGDTHGCHPTKAQATEQLRALYANVPDARKKSTDDDSEPLLLAYGGAVKSVPGSTIIEGLAVPFGSPDERDLDGEYFSPETDFGLQFPARVHLFYNHGLDVKVGRVPLGRAELWEEADGIHFKADLNPEADDEEVKWLDGEREKSRKYRRLALKLAHEGLVGSSSGAASHVVVKAGPAIKRWPFPELSVTVHPANRATVPVTVKALSELPSLEEAAGTAPLSLSLAENTEQWLDRGEDLLGRYRCLGQAEVKAGRAISAARMQRLQQAHSLIGQIIEECQMPEPQDTGDAEPPGEETSPAEATETMAPGMGSPDTLTALRKRDQISTRGRAALTLYGS